jgi:nucleoredoxin
MKKAEVVAFYFSAKWCNPCKMFTPILSKFYELVNKESKQLEIIFVSSDENESEFKDYFSKMPWLAIPFSEELREIGAKYGVQGIPSLFIINKEDGEVKSYKGR